MKSTLFGGRLNRILLPLLFFAFSSTAAELVVPLGLPDIPSQFRTRGDRRAALGEKLFFDTHLSADGTVSCASCHIPQRNFTDGRALAVGIDRQIGTRNVPSLYNVVFANALFWDGRAGSLESQAKLPLLNSREHGLVSESKLLFAIEGSPAYRKQFTREFRQSRITTQSVMVAIATYERTLLSGDSPFDRYFYGGDQSAMTAAAIRGLEFFRGRAGCATCHIIGKTSALFNDQGFHASPTELPDSVNSALVELTQRAVDVHKNGDPNELNSLIGSNSGIAALGRFLVTRVPSDIGLFRTPSLRNVAATAPYLHDGSIATLEEVVEAELYNRAGEVRSPIVATTEERADLIEFLKTLSSSQRDSRPSYPSRGPPQGVSRP